MKISERIAKLINIKSIVTLITAACFIYLAVTGTISGEQFLTIFTVIISFYFGTQYGKPDGQNNETKDN